MPTSVFCPRKKNLFPRSWMSCGPAISSSLLVRVIFTAPVWGCCRACRKEGCVRPELRERVTSLLGERVRFSFPLARHTSFRIGGPADAFAEPDTLGELQTLLAWLHEESVPVFLLGGGTNILVSDRGVRGVVVKLGDGFNYERWAESATGATVRVGAASSLGRFVRAAVRKGYRGVEFAEGIPGTVGGGLLMNAGAFGGELSAVVVAIAGVHRDGRNERLPGATL